MDQKNLQISKIEQFVGVHPSVDDFLKNILPRYVGQIIFDPVFVREKIIEKYPSEKLVYSVHNDLPALYTTVASSVCVAYLSLDRTNKDNGCLYMQNQPVTTRPCIECQCFNGAPCQCQGYSGQSAIPENKIDIQADLRDADLSTNWVEVTTEPGDLVLFDGLTPHYSTRNIDGSPRRYLYGVYAPSGNIRPEIDANDLRNEWYRWFRDHLSEHRHAWANI
jgi:ectoine hydroxylase-related dioxygenase (phytanoyl-CoA dioxygenase family)